MPDEIAPPEKGGRNMDPAMLRTICAVVTATCAILALVLTLRRDYFGKKR